MNISVVGTGYVGLVTSVCLAEVGHFVTAYDINVKKIGKLQNGESPIFEPGLESLLKKNQNDGRLRFTSDPKIAYNNVEIAFIAVGTPQLEDGSADLSFVKQAADDIALNIAQDTIIVIKSTVPVGTNDMIKKRVSDKLVGKYKIDVVSNPEFLREGSAVNDTFKADRIVIGSDCKKSAEKVRQAYLPFEIPIYETDLRSAEMIKYASNAFLATKISFINEIANICEKVGADIEFVSEGMAKDHRIGPHFLNAGIGYGGSCFPKDTKALMQIAGNVEHHFELLESVIKVNNHQQMVLINKIKDRFGSLKGLRIALLGLSFKPNTDDMREAPSVRISQELVRQGARLIGFDPLAVENAKRLLPSEVEYEYSIQAAVEGCDAAIILTEWDVIKKLDLSKLSFWMNTPIIFDGRNIFSLNQAKRHSIEYYSIGRPNITTIVPASRLNMS